MTGGCDPRFRLRPFDEVESWMDDKSVAHAVQEANELFAALGKAAEESAREGVHQLSTVGEVSCVEEVVAVEEVQGRIGHTHILPMRRAGGGLVLCRYVVVRWRRVS